mmetsp:Transcript_35803/g.58361  ORF Transcript_35803/g.58361 Transcript_35803/m.58361 type:complete len:192 (+) Transcript_35803:3-578(+)
MKEINSKLMVEKKEGEENEWMKCMDDTHRMHAETRKELVFGETRNGVGKIMDNDSSGTNVGGDDLLPVQILQSRLGERGANDFLDAGVAGASRLAKTADVKCLHAWLADYLFREQVDDGSGGDVVSSEHVIGDAIVKELKEKFGVDISGIDSCQEVCSGAASSGTSISVPFPTNKQRKKRRQLENRCANDQ